MGKYFSILFLCLAFFLYSTVSIKAAPVIGAGSNNVSNNSSTDPVPVDIKINTPLSGVDPNIGLGSLISNALTIVFVIAALIVLVMMVWGALSWILSGGDKEAVGKARGRITGALIGLALLALAFLITRVVGQVVSIDILELSKLPTLSQCADKPFTVFNPKSGDCEPVKCSSLKNEADCKPVKGCTYGGSPPTCHQ